jgi:8-oxo-dGTP pyrophosphatase MutT (NUDIX family)
MDERTRAGIILVENGRVLLIERRREGKHYFVCPGGGVEPGESFEAAAVREAREELGVDVELTHAVFQVNFGGQQKYFVGQVVGGTVQLLPFDEHKLRGSYQPAWIPIERLIELDVRPPELLGWIRTISAEAG